LSSQGAVDLSLRVERRIIDSGIERIGRVIHRVEATRWA